VSLTVSTPTSRTALYARVSKEADQDLETQFVELRRWAKDTGTKGAKEYSDPLSSRDRRPQKEEVLRLARLGLVNRIVVVRLDRWGRSLDELVPELNEFTERKVEFISLREGFRLDSDAGRLYAQLIGCFAEFERDVIRERTVAGLSRARAQGKIGGRHPVGCGCGIRPEDGKNHEGRFCQFGMGTGSSRGGSPTGRSLPGRRNLTPQAQRRRRRPRTAPVGIYRAFDLRRPGKSSPQGGECPSARYS
jgi:putative DNA-invertase from lambdoid prophage Rac